jgi:16S rRNA G527 N7-methylase RsmG
LIQLNVFITDEDVKDQTTVESSEIKKKQMEQLEKSKKLLKSLNQSYNLELPYE